MSLSCQKHLFSLDPEIHYLNCSYKGPLLKSAEIACLEALKRNRNPIEISPDDFFNITDEVKYLFSQIVNTNANNIAISPSTSYAFASLLKNTPSKKNGKAICIEDEFPSAYYALQRWTEVNENKLVIIPRPKSLSTRGEDWHKAIIEAIDESTSIVVLSTVHWMSGLKFDLKLIAETCEKYGAYLFVDGTQSVGALPIDLSEIKLDGLICAAYKWLLGPYSSCLSYVSERLLNGIPLEESWMNRSNAHDFSSLTNYTDQYAKGATRYNVGETSFFLNMPILKSGLTQILEWGVQSIQDYAQSLSQPLISYLNKYNLKLFSDDYLSYHLLGIDLSALCDMDKLKSQLIENQIYLSQRDKFLRIAINVFNTEEDISALIQAIDKSKY